MENDFRSNALKLWFTVWAIAKKEFKHLFRNKMFWRGMIVMQGLQLAMLGFLDTQVRDLPLVVVDQDRTSYSRELLAKLKATAMFDVRYVTNNTSEARELIRAGNAKVGVIIPPDFHEKRSRGTTATVLTLVDGSDAQASGAAIGTMSELSARLSTDAIKSNQSCTLAMESHNLVLFNPEGRAPNFLLPGLLVIMLGNLLMLAVMGIVRERDSGTLERLLMTPLSITGLMLGKAMPIIIVGVANSIAILLAMRWAFQVPIRGSLALILLACTLYVLTVAAIGVYFGCTSTNPMEAGQRSGYLMLPTTFLSGYLWPLSSIPKILLPIAYALPATHMVEVMRASVLRDARFTDIFPHIAYLAFVPIVIIFYSVRKFRETIGTV